MYCLKWIRWTKMFCLRCNRKAFRDGEKTKDRTNMTVRFEMSLDSAQRRIDSWPVSRLRPTRETADSQTDHIHSSHLLTRYMSSQPPSSINSSLFNLLAALALHLSSVSLGRQQRLLGHATRMSDNRITRYVEWFHRGPRRPRQTRRNTVTNDLRESKLSWEDLQATAAEDSDGVSVWPSASWIRMNQGQNTPPT